jgi:putative nucleotidyltransferase with HDIG domain
MVQIGAIQYVIPELEASIGVEQNQAHSYDVYTHLLKSLQCSADKGYPIEIRLSALLHDISKPETRRFSHETRQFTFYGHEVVGSRVTKEVLSRLKFPVKLIDKVVKMVRWHMFFSDTEEISLSAVRRMIVNVGKENIWDLMNVRICDRIGTGRPKEDPYRLRKYHAMIDEAMRDPITVGMLKVDGASLIEMGIPAGPRIGFILSALLEEVLNDPKKNTVEYLKERIMFLMKLSDNELKDLGDSGKKAREALEEEQIKELRSKHRVQ